MGRKKNLEAEARVCIQCENVRWHGEDFFPQSQNVATVCSQQKGGQRVHDWPVPVKARAWRPMWTCACVCVCWG